MVTIIEVFVNKFLQVLPFQKIIRYFKVSIHFWYVRNSELLIIELLPNGSVIKRNNAYEMQLARKKCFEKNDFYFKAKSLMSIIQPKTKFDKCVKLFKN